MFPMKTDIVSTLPSFPNDSRAQDDKTDCEDIYAKSSSALYLATIRKNKVRREGRTGRYILGRTRMK